MHRWISANREGLFAVLNYLDTPVSLATWLLIENREWDQLATRWVDPLHYPEGVFSALRYRRDVQAVDLFRKAPLPTSINRRDAALKAWEDAETQCAKTNEMLRNLMYIRDEPGAHHFCHILAKAEKWISRRIGPLPPDLLGGFGPGTCVEYEGSSPTVVDKIWLTPTTTPSAAPYFSVLYGRTHWGLARTKAGLEFQGTSRGNRLTTVPKDGKTDRPICIEPLGNLWLQLGVGRHLKKRLRACGLPRFGDTAQEIFPGLTRSFDSAQDVHRHLAEKASLSGKYATIDLSSASDTVSLELIRWLLPPDWFELMNDLRAHHTLLPKSVGGHWRRIEKFSSMGNGFTFELETFVFLGLLSAAFGLAPGKSIWVFGDDIIVPTGVAAAACNLLELCGFSINRKKSFISGPFRESCGGHFHSGLDVNPVRLKGDLDNLSSLIAFHNALVTWGFPSRVTKHFARCVPSKYRIYGPRRLGDIVLHGPKWKSVSRRGSEWVRTIKFVPQDPIPLDRWSPELSLTAILLGVPPKLFRRGARVTPAFGWASVS